MSDLRLNASTHRASHRAPMLVDLREQGPEEHCVCSTSADVSAASAAASAPHRTSARIAVPARRSALIVKAQMPAKPAKPASREVSAKVSLGVAEVQNLIQLTADNYNSFLMHQSDHLTVVDFFTNWCAPCKCSTPILQRWSGEYDTNKVSFASVDCEEGTNKALAAAMGVKALPTFMIYKNGELIATTTGAKMEKLRKLIDSHK
eukprot:gene26550-18317_t